VSLLISQRMFAGHDQCSVASLEADGNFYRCYVYLNRTQWRVEAVCERVQPNGTSVVVFHNTVATATPTEITDTSGIPLDCPKIIASGTVFVVHWLQAEDVEVVGGTATRTWDLYRATQDMESFSESSWTQRGSTALYRRHLLYDVTPIIGHASDFVVAWYDSVPNVTVRRYDGYTWLDSVWNDSRATTINPTVLAVYANETDRDVLVCYELTADGELYTNRYDALTGSMTATVQSFTALAACSYFQAAFCQVATDVVALVVECRLDSNLSVDVLTWGNNFIHHLAYVALNSGTAVQTTNEHWAPNLYMLSAPWAYAGEVYVLAAYKSVLTHDDWSQSYAYVLRLEYNLWDDIADGPRLRPRSICNVYTPGLPDGRASGWKPDGALHQGGPVRRGNHVSGVAGAPPFGPDVKTRTVATVVWGAVGTQNVLQDPTIAYNASTNPYRSSLQAERAGVRGLVVYLDDPWTVYTVDSNNPTQPDENFCAAYPRTMHQSVPAGRGLFIGGGCPHIYDGHRVVECGFPWKPEILLADAIVGTDNVVGDMVANNTYQVYACYSWTDGAGQTHRSGPSNVLEINFPAGDAVQYTIRCVNISLKDAQSFDSLAQSIQIEVYRTISIEDGGGTFYKLFSATEVDLPLGQNFRPRDTPVNDPEAASGTIQFYDGLSDERLLLHSLAPYQYNADGVFVEPLPMTVPAMSVVATGINRIWGADALDPSVIYYTDEIIPDYGAAFYTVPVWSTQLSFRIGEVGEVTGMCWMNNAMIAFTRDAIYSLTAQSAASVDNPALLTITAELLHEGTGCIEPRSVILTPLGVMFQTLKGYYLLSRNRELGYYSLARSRDEAFSTSGSEIEEDIVAGGNIRAACMLPDRQQVRLTTNGPLVTTQTWTTTIANAGDPGTYTISGLAAAIEYEGTNGQTNAQVATGIAAVISALRGTTLQFEVASVAAVGSTVVLVMLPDVDVTITGDGPGTSVVTPVLAEDSDTQPRVLIYDYLQQKWSRADLVQTSATTRLAELVDGCSWHGSEGGTLHVALAQGAVLIEREPGDALEFADETSVADVGVPLYLRTSWIVLASLAGYVRFKSIGVQTERIDADDLTAVLEYDISGTYDGQEIYPTEYTWTSPAPDYLRIRPEQQKVNAVRLTIDEGVGVSTTENLAVVAIVLEVGVKPGLKRVSDAQIGSA
jgi:hypothetical protein